MSYLRIITLLRSAAAIALAAVVVALPAQAAQPNDDILGRWRITKVLDSSDISALDDKEAAALVGKIFIIEPDKVSLAGDVCKDPDFNRHYEDTVRYLREEAHASSWKLGLPEVVTIVDLSCAEALVKSYNKIVVYWQGFFFDAVKLEPGMPGQQVER
jgi:hypothetical protein